MVKESGLASTETDYIVLHVEDNDTDAYLLRLALQDTGAPAVVYRVSDGEQALLLLQKRNPFGRAPTPNLVFLDINMPKIDGWEVLSTMQANETLRSIPVVILTTSQHDKQKALALGARDYICKPLQVDDFLAEVQNAYKAVSYDCQAASEGRVP